MRAVQRAYAGIDACPRAACCCVLGRRDGRRARSRAAAAPLALGVVLGVLLALIGAAASGSRAARARRAAVSRDGGERRSERRAGRGTACEGLRPRRCPLARDGAGEARIARGLGEPALFAITLSAIVSSIFFSLGVVAGDALGLTPVVFLLAAGFFVITMATYVEGNSLHPERGGASTFARYAFDELWSFMAGWAILLDYLIVMALAARGDLRLPGGVLGRAPGDGREEIADRRRRDRLRGVANIRGLSARAAAARCCGCRSSGIVLFVAIVGDRCSPSSSTSASVFDTVDLGAQPDLGGRGVRHRDRHRRADRHRGRLGPGRRGAGRAARACSGRDRGLAARRWSCSCGVSAAALMAVPVRGRGTPRSAARFEQAPGAGRGVRARPGVAGGRARATRWARWRGDPARQAMNGQMLGLAGWPTRWPPTARSRARVGRLHPRRGTPYVAIAIGGGDRLRPGAARTTSTSSPGSSPSARCSRSRSRTCR